MLARLTLEEEESTDVKFINKLPTSVKAMQKLVLDDWQTPRKTLIGLRRVRDYHNPALHENKANEADFVRFMISLLLVWSDLPRKSDLKEPILKHLKELSGSPETAPAFVGFARE